MQERSEPHIPVPPRHTAHTDQPAWHALPGTESGARRASRVSLGRSPFLHRLRRPALGFVRRLRRYYGIVGLPTIAHHGITASAFPARPALPSPQADDRGTSRFSRPEIPRMHRFSDPAGSADGSRKRRRRCCLPPCRTTSAPQTRRLRGSIARPARTPTDASPPPSRTTTHGSGPSWTANPSMLDSLIPFSGPVYPGAPYTNPRTIPHQFRIDARGASGNGVRDVRAIDELELHGSVRGGLLDGSANAVATAGTSSWRGSASGSRAVYYEALGQSPDSGSGGCPAEGDAGSCPLPGVAACSGADLAPTARRLAGLSRGADWMRGHSRRNRTMP